jgi:hypothetical protein
MLFYLVKWFQRRRFLEIDQPVKELPMQAMFDNRSGQNEQSL